MSRALLLQVYKESSKRALDEQFGGEDESPHPPPGFTSPTLKLTKYSNAYMLVYVRESSWKDIMLEVSQDDIAEHVRSRLKVCYPRLLCLCCVMLLQLLWQSTLVQLPMPICCCWWVLLANACCTYVTLRFGQHQLSHAVALTAQRSECQLPHAFLSFPVLCCPLLNVSKVDHRLCVSLLI